MENTFISCASQRYVNFLSCRVFFYLALLAIFLTLIKATVQLPLLFIHAQCKRKHSQWCCFIGSFSIFGWVQLNQMTYYKRLKRQWTIPTPQNKSQPTLNSFCNTKKHLFHPCFKCISLCFIFIMKSIRFIKKKWGDIKKLMVIKINYFDI